MKKLIVIWLCVIPLLLGARPAAPDNDAILTEIINAASPNYYPSLMRRYMSGDRTLTNEQYHLLYYGYAYQDTYSPLEPLPAAGSILSLIEQNLEPDSIQCLQIIGWGKEVMAKDPFSPTNLNMMAYAYTIIGEVDAARTNAIRVQKILETITASGTGASEKSPWVVLSFSHAEDVMRWLGEIPHHRRVVSRTVEYIDTGKRGSGVLKGCFFDFSRAYWNKPEVTPTPDKRGWEFNGIKLNNKK